MVEPVRPPSLARRPHAPHLQVSPGSTFDLRAPSQGHLDVAFLRTQLCPGASWASEVAPLRLRLGRGSSHTQVSVSSVFGCVSVVTICHPQVVTLAVYTFFAWTRAGVTQVTTLTSTSPSSPCCSSSTPAG